MRKKLLAMLTVVALLAAMVPQALFADTAKDLRIQIINFGPGNEKALITLSGVEVGQQYEVVQEMKAVNGTTSPKSVVARTNITKTGDTYFEIKNEGFQNGDRLVVKIYKENNDLLKEDFAVYKVDNSVPKKMTVTTDSVQPNATNQDVRVRVNRDYENADGDKFRLTPYDKDGKLMYRVGVEEYKVKDVTSGTREDYREFRLTLPKVYENVAYYEVQFVKNNSVVNGLTQKVMVSPDLKDVKDLVLGYKADKTVNLGKEYVADPYLLLNDGRKYGPVKVIYTFSGDALDKYDKETGKFTVKTGKEYIGKTITVSGLSNNKVVTSVFTVADESGNTVVEPEMTNTSVYMIINAKDYFINQKKYQMDAYPLIKNNRTYVPLRAMAEAFGAKVDFDNPTQTITITYGKKVITMTVGQKNYVADGSAKVMDVEPYIVKKSERTMVPVRFAAEAMGFKVEATSNKDGTTSGVMFKNSK